MRKKIIPTDPSWPSWRYSPDGHKGIFKNANEVPLGWTEKPQDTPGLPGTEGGVQETREELIALLVEEEVDFEHQWGRTKLKEVLDDYRSAR